VIHVPAYGSDDRGSGDLPGERGRCCWLDRPGGAGHDGNFTGPTLAAGRDGTTLIGLSGSRGFAVSRVAGGAPGTPVLLRAASTPFGESDWLAFTPRRRLVAVGTESSRGQRVWLAEGLHNRPHHQDSW